MAKRKSAEEEVIARFRRGLHDASVLRGIGDDAAVLRTRGALVATCDTLTAGTHFTADANPYYLGRKALAVNLSDLAAMGATPKHALLALTLPKVDASWLNRFARGLLQLAADHKVAIVGGDVCAGKTLTITITALGTAPRKPLYQSGVKPGDDVWVSGVLGQAAAEFDRQRSPSARSALHNPQPQVELGRFLAGVASAAVDLSDGLAKGAAALSINSRCGLRLAGDSLPLYAGIDRDRALSFGEDYQLLFTARPARRDAISRYGRSQGLRLTRIGCAEGSACVIEDQGKTIDIQTLARKSYDHFNNKESGADRDLRALGRLAQRQRARLAVAESCTAGLLGARLADLPGASAWFAGGVISYATDVKRLLLGVPAALLKRAGPVSMLVAESMAQGAMRTTKSTHAAAITGWASPGKGARPGLVCVCCADRAGQVIGRQFKFGGGRSAIRIQAVDAAVRMLLDLLERKAVKSKL